MSTFSVMHPLKGAGRVSSQFGYRKHPISGEDSNHNGTDLAAPEGTPVYAAADGKVSVVTYNHAVAGNYITLDHPPLASGERFGTDYLHLSKIHVTKGQEVREGDLIGEVGTTGRSTGPHLHFNVQQKAPVRQWVDPQNYIARISPNAAYFYVAVAGVVTVSLVAIAISLRWRKNR